MRMMKAMRMRYLVAGSLLFVGMIAIVQAQPGFGFGFGGGRLPSLVNKAVQEDLKMTEDQVKKVEEWAKEFNTKIDEIYKSKERRVRKGVKGGFRPTTRKSWPR